jgi:hypothetical protein
MDVLASRQPADWEDEVKQLYKALEPPRAILELKGSASLASQRYFSDYDFFCSVPYKPTLRFINTIRTKLSKLSYVYPIEVKIETHGGEKYRYYTDEPITKLPKDTRLIKVDLVVNINFIFTEVSCIYSFTPQRLTSEEYIEELKTEIEELKKEGKYYKILKRLFSIYKILGDDAKLVALTRYFNSPEGLAYQRTSNYDALKLVKQYYSTPELDKRVLSNMKTVGLYSDEERDALYKKLNATAKRKLKTF